MLGDPNDPLKVEGEPPAAETVLRRYIAGEIELSEAESTIDDLIENPMLRCAPDGRVYELDYTPAPYQPEGPVAEMIERDLEQNFPNSL